MAAEIDSAEEIAADDYGVGIRVARRILADREAEVRRNQAETLARVIGLLLLAKNPRITIRCLALAFGFDSMNGYHSQSEVAKEEGVTRALISHYVLGWRDVLSGGVASFDCLKFRKKQATRETFRRVASSSFIAAKEAAKQKYKENEVKSFIIISNDGRRFIVQAKDKQSAINQAQSDGIEVGSVELA